MAILGREYVVAVQPRERGLMMFTLRQASEVRQMSQIEELDQVPDTVNPDEIKLAQQVIGNFAGDLESFRVQGRVSGRAPTHYRR